MSDINNDFFSYNLDEIDTTRIHNALIRAFKTSTNTDPKLTLDTTLSAPNLCSDSLIDKDPPISTILGKIPCKENIKSVFFTPGIYSLIYQLYNKDEISHLFPFLFSNAPIDPSDQLYRHLSSINEGLIHESLNCYFGKFVSDSKTVLNAILKCAPLVIAAHRSRLKSLQLQLSEKDSHSSTDQNEDALFMLPYSDIRQLRSQPWLPDEVDEDLDSDSDSSSLSKLRIKVLNEIDIFRSPNYNLIPYFEVELHLLKETNNLEYTKALDYLEKLVSERESILPLDSENIQTHRPTRCVKLMSFISRKIFSGLSPCEDTRIYNSMNIKRKGLPSDYSPILSLHTNEGLPLTRAHGEVYDAICTLWVAGNNVISDTMIARAIWPRSNYHGSETFSLSELDTIRQLVDELRSTFISIDATEELRKYKKIGQDDFWKTSDYAIPSSIVYQPVNGGDYHRFYKLLRIPILFAYSAILAQIFSGPITILEPKNKANKRSPRTLKSAQVRSFLLERIHHFSSISYKKRENKILVEGIYDVYKVRNGHGSNIEKKDRIAARKAAVEALNNFKREGLISEYRFIKKGEKYIYLQVNL